MKKLILIITILSFGLINFAQVADSLDVQKNDTAIVKKDKDKTIKITYGDKELLNLNINADEFDMSDFDESKKGDTTRLRVGKKNIIIIEDNDNKDYSNFDDKENKDYSYFDNEDEDEDDDKSKKIKAHWSGVALGMNNYLNSDLKLALPEGGEFMELNTNKSVELSLNFAEKAFPIFKNKLCLVTGMGIKWNNYHFDRNIKLNTETNFLSADSIASDSVTYTKNRLGTTFLTVPVLLDYRFNVGKEHKTLYFAAGVIGGLKLGSNFKQKHSTDRTETKYKEKEDYNISPYTLGVTARIGYESVNLFANYNLTPLFEKDKGPVLNPFTVGISLTADLD
ncbi:outer membrane beta-barrel protein [Bacteroidota bacterium]